MKYSVWAECLISAAASFHQKTLKLVIEGLLKYINSPK